MKQSRSIIITGTHHTPAIELIKLLSVDPKTNWDIHYLGHLYPSETHILHTIIPKLKVPFYNLNSGKFDRKNLLPTIISLPKIIFSFFKSLGLIDQIKPDVVVSFGGYVSVPVVIAAFIKGIPSITHEQTLTTSLSTKINYFFVKKIALSFSPTSLKPKEVVTGNLIRQDIFDTSSHKFRKLSPPIIYVTGGNQGSEFLNDVAVKIAPMLKQYTILHQTGKKLVPNLKLKNYYQLEYVEIEDIGWVLNHSQIIISRSGANICQEINILHKNSVLIPLPFTQQDEQTKNALWVKHQQPQNTVVISQSDATIPKIINAIKKLSTKKTMAINHHQNHTSHPLLDLIYELI